MLTELLKVFGLFCHQSLYSFFKGPAINPFELPLLNTVILLSSGVTITYAYYSLIQGNRAGALYGLVAIVILAVVFIGF